MSNIERLNVKDRTLFIADNLEILRGFNDECVDLIYLDPPFNTNKQYKAPIGSQAEGAEFKDIWTDEDIKHEWHGVIAARNDELYQIIQASETVYDKSMKIYLMAMAVRLFEMKRILKRTGSIYLHCDPTASHYLKLVMDSLFGKNLFRNEITWRRHSSVTKGSQHAPKTWGTTTDTILFYAGKNAKLAPYRDMPESERIEQFPKVGEKGERYYDDSAHIWRTPNMGARPNLCYEWRGFVNPHPSGWRLSKDRLEEEYQKGNIVITRDGKLERRKYERDFKGKQVGNLWTDIPIASGKERTGYPTQKPLALLHRIINASSNPGDVVLDPFCGCATACVAAEQLARKWIGIDISPDAEVITKIRLQEIVDDDSDLFNPFTDVSVLAEPPTPTHKRVDETQLDLPKAHVHKHELYGQQEGKCAGCNYYFPFRNMTIDHILAQAKSGTDHKDNLQLLCSACNSTKGTNTQEELISTLKARGDLTE